MNGIASLLRPTNKAAVVRLVAVLVIVGGVLGASWSWAADRGTGQTLLDATLVQLEDQVRLDPQNVQARLAVALAYATRGYNSSAIEQFQEVIALEENNQAALAGLGRVYLQEGKLDQGLEPLLKVVELNKDNPLNKTLGRLEAVYYDLGVIYSRKKLYTEAAFYLSRALEINRADADAWYVLGQAQAGGADFESALSSYHQAVRFVPDFVEVYKGMADVYSRVGSAGGKKYASGMIYLTERSYDKATRDLQEATRLAPDMAQAHEGLGMALESLGRSEEALDSYRSAAELDPSLIVAQLAVQRLSSSGR